MRRPEEESTASPAVAKVPPSSESSGSGGSTRCSDDASSYDGPSSGGSGHSGHAALPAVVSPPACLGAPAVTGAAAARPQWEVDPAEVILGDRVGVGATAEVFRSCWHGTDVAVKRLQGSSPPSSWFERELSVLLQLRHPNLVLFMGASLEGHGPPMIVSEFCEGGTVFGLLHQRGDLPLSWRQRVKMALDTAKGMNFLHRRRVVHRDLKSLNVLLAAKVERRDDVPWAKISDFGLSRNLPKGARLVEGGVEPVDVASMMTMGLGTYLWMAPEVLSGGSYDERVDIYSYGMVLYELVCRRIPFDGSGLEPINIAVAVSRGCRPDTRYVPHDCPAELSGAMERCWAHDPFARPAFDALLALLKEVVPPCPQ